MAIFDRLFGRSKEEAALTSFETSGTLPHAGVEDVLATEASITATWTTRPTFPCSCSSRTTFRSTRLYSTKRLCAFHPALNIATMEIDAGSIRNCAPALDRARWGMHTVDFVGHNTPLSSSNLQSCCARDGIDLRTPSSNAPATIKRQRSLGSYRYESVAHRPDTSR